MKRLYALTLLLFITLQPSLANNTNQQTIINTLNKEKKRLPFTLMVENQKGDILTHSVGASNENRLYKSASTSKWVTATIILELVQEGKLSLSDHPQKYLSFWRKKGNLSKITLKELLSFTSGLKNKPFCLNFKRANFEKCVKRIMKKNNAPSRKTFAYGPNHLQVAGLMAIKASGLNSWEELFTQFKKRHHLFQNSNYDLPSISNPRLAGGMHWSAKEYLAFLEALYNKKILNETHLRLMTQDQLGSASIGDSPAKRGMKEDWHYGFGVWIECHADNFNCTKTTRVSSPGAYGAYPFMDFEHGYYGIVALQARYGKFTKGYEIFKRVEKGLIKWAK